MTIEEALKWADRRRDTRPPGVHDVALITLAAAYRAKCEECKSLAFVLEQAKEVLG